MFRYNKDELSQKVNDLNFIRDTLEKVLRLVDVLAYLNSNPLTRQAEIAELMHVSKQTVQTIRQLYSEKGLDDAIGRKKKFTHPRLMTIASVARAMAI